MHNFSITWQQAPEYQPLTDWLEKGILPQYLPKCRWFAGKARHIKTVEIKNTLPIGNFHAFICEVNYAEGEAENYLLPISILSLSENLPEKAILSEISLSDKSGLLVDAIYDPAFREKLFEQLLQNTQTETDAGAVVYAKGKALDDTAVLVSSLPEIDSSNSAMVFGNKYFLKLYRKLFRETNPEVELVEFISQNSDFQHIPLFAGSIAWKRTQTPDVTLGMMVLVIENEKDAWSKTGDYLNDFVNAFVEGNFQVRENVFDSVTLLAQRTAQMHLALFAKRADEAFAAETFDRQYRRYIHQRMEKLLEKRYNLLLEHYQRLDVPSQALAWQFMEAKELIDAFIDQILTRPLDSFRTRIHGDYHLGQVLVANDDYTIIDFEGEPESSISDRKIKHSPLKDVAGMIRSYHYAISAKLFNAAETAEFDMDVLQRASDRWYKLMRDTYLEAYLNYFGSPHPLFKNDSEINYLLLFYLLEKAVYELGYELNSRPSWVKIPLRGIVDVVKELEKMQFMPS